MKRIAISGVDSTHTNQLADRISKVYGSKIMTKDSQGIWGVDKEENVIILCNGPAEALVDKPMQSVDMRIKAYEALTHIIFVPLITAPKQWVPASMYEACLQTAYKFLVINSSKRPPMIILPQQSKEDNWRMVTSLLSNLIIAR